MIRLARGDFGFFMVENLDDSGTKTADLLVQTDYDFPGIAGTFGWSTAAVPVLIGRRYDQPDAPCSHDSTDGTITCAGCGLPAWAFISSAADYLDAHIGATADDPGYFAAS